MIEKACRGRERRRWSPRFDRGQRPLPALLGVDLAEALGGDGGDQQHQGDQRAAGQRERQLGGPAQVLQGWVEGQAEEGDERQHQPAGEPLEHDAGEAVGQLPVVAGEAGHPEHVAPMVVGRTLATNWPAR